MYGRFADRADAGRALAVQLKHYAQRDDVVVLGLPRGGVPVAYEVARALGAPLDVLVVRKLGVPWQCELAMGAIASGDALYVDEELMRETGVSQPEFERVLAEEKAQLARRETLFRDPMRARVDVTGRIAIIVDDGLATGASMKVAARALRARAPARIVAALPVAPSDAARRIGGDVDEYVCVNAPELFFSVSQFYSDFSETTDDDVRAILARASSASGPASCG
ncbi:phosphoribosyltransferase [Paraburkholderia caribensis]|uniref:Phosphoribosyl transferase n=1 Tax=Paraburkholderia caribensis TaxID=75105 RepID=A0A9Q6WK64_9BURK|nr:phosphoribosyltransferase [Paraburkholderia caribensis]MCO4880402.1 phosphoribosyltransferase [Paraburkholderia caribensis]PTB23067.1 phosphoribosyl transferase [Paraburkholderia caribensis]QLB61156.1 phosphoribosyl transferase [Paraburkholderia caribensis]